jgi:tripeptidyl-peptidase I
MRLLSVLGAVWLTAFQATATPLLADDKGGSSGPPGGSNSLGPYVVHERHTDHHVRGWSRKERASSVSLLPMRVGLKQRNLDRGHDLLMDM